MWFFVIFLHQPAAVSSGFCSSHLRGGEPLEFHHGRVLPLCSRSLPLAPAAARGLAQLTFRSASLPRPPFLRTSRRRRAVAFASAGRLPTARGRFRIRRPASDGLQSLSHPPAGCRWRAVGFPPVRPLSVLRPRPSPVPRRPAITIPAPPAQSRSTCRAQPSGSGAHVVWPGVTWIDRHLRVSGRDSSLARLVRPLARLDLNTQARLRRVSGDKWAVARVSPGLPPSPSPRHPVSESRLRVTG